MDILIVFVADVVAEVFSNFLFTFFRSIQNYADFAIFLLVIQEKIIYGRMLLRQNAGTDLWMTDEVFYLFRSKMP